MQKCLDDLEEKYAKCRVSRSEPVVPFRETIIEPPKVDQVGESFGEQERHFMRKFEEEKEEEDEDGDNVEPREELNPQETKIKLYSPIDKQWSHCKLFRCRLKVRHFTNF